MANTKPLKMLRRGLNWRTLLKPFRTPAVRIAIMHGMILIGFFALLGKFLSSEQWFFPVVIGFSLLLGILHVWLTYGVHDWAKRMEGNGIRETIFTLLINIFGAIAFYYLFNAQLPDYALIASISLSVFSLPFFWDKAFYSNLLIPEKEYEPLMIRETESIVGKVNVKPCGEGIFFHFTDKTKDSDLPDVPRRMYMPQRKNEHSVEVILKTFIHFYKEKFSPENPIRLGRIDEEGVRFFKWFIHKEPYPFLKIKGIVDPKKTIAENNIRYKKWSGKDQRGMQLNLNCIHLFIERIQLNDKQDDVLNTEESSS